MHTRMRCVFQAQSMHVITEELESSRVQALKIQLFRAFLFSGTNCIVLLLFILKHIPVFTNYCEANRNGM